MYEVIYIYIYNIGVNLISDTVEYTFCDKSPAYYKMMF